jgi:hypothetical protein
MDVRPQAASEASGDVKGRLMGLGAAVLLLPIIYLFAQHREQSRGFVVFCVTGVFLSVIYARRRELRLRLLIAIAALYAVQLAIALFIPLPERIAGAAMIPITIADAVLMLWLLHLIDRSLARLKGNSSAS